MALDCLNTFIALSGCVPVTASQINLASLPGISTDIVEKITDATRESWVQTLADVLALAAPEFKALVGETIQEIRPIYGTCGCGSCDTDTIICTTPADFVAAYAYFVAYQLAFRRLTSDRMNSATVNVGKIRELMTAYDEKCKVLLKEAIRSMDLSTCCGGTEVPQTIKTITNLP